MKKAVIFGVTGQDGSYLSDLLIEKGYEVIGVSRRSSTPNTSRISHLLANPNFLLIEGDITDFSSVYRILSNHLPNEVYNLAAQSHVKVSFDEPVHTTNVVYGGCLNILEAIRMLNGSRKDYDLDTIRFYQASSSEMFGASKGERNTPKDLEYQVANNLITTQRHQEIIQNSFYQQDESTPYLPCSPYAIAKLAAHNAVRVYREAYGLHASSGILFNHESERRGEAFVTRKITKYVAWLRSQTPEQMVDCKLLELGNLDAVRDWGHAKDYVRAMWLMLQQEKPDDYVIATGEKHTVKDFLDVAFGYIGVRDWTHFVKINAQLQRPSEVNYLCGNYTKAQIKLGWSPAITFKSLVSRMVEHDYAELLRLQRPEVREVASVRLQA